MIISRKLKENISHFSIIILSILPLWLFDKDNLFNIRILIFFISLLTIFYILLIIINQLDKNYIYLFLSLIIFYGLDSKISFWIFFENQVFLGWYKYLFSFLFCLIFSFLIFLSLKKSNKSKRIFLICLSTLIIINIAPNYFHKNQIYLIENIEVKKKNNINKKKTIILHLDEIVGYNGIDEKIPFGNLAKKSYLDTLSESNFEIYASAYSIYNNTVDSIPNLLNFNFNTNKKYKSKFNKYVRWNKFDRGSKWKVVENKFFENNQSKKIIASKEQSADFCYKFVSACLYSNHINTYGKYVDFFEFKLKDYIFKKSYNQKTIFFHYFWRFIKFVEKKLSVKLFNDYHFFVFHKVKFENDLNNLVKLISNTDYDIYFSHLIFPHKPFTFEYNEEKNECYFEEKYINEFDYNNTKSLLTQHYKEIICTNLYLRDFFNQLKLEGNFQNYDILLISDTGTITENENKNGFLRDNYSVLYARKTIKNGNFKINNEFISSQELFSQHFNEKHIELESKAFKARVHLYDTNEYIEVEDFMAY